MFDIEEVNKDLSYDPETGALIWKSTRHNRVKIGSRAGSVDSSADVTYRKITIHGSTYKEHRIIWRINYGEWPDNIDHIDGDGCNNKLSNLRSVSAQENLKNKSRYITNTSGTMGVHRVKRSGRWCARITYNGLRIALGTFDNKQDAIQAREQANKRYGYHANHNRCKLPEKKI